MKKIFLLVILFIVKMNTINAQSGNYNYATVPTQFVEANGIKLPTVLTAKKVKYLLFISTT